MNLLISLTFTKFRSIIEELIVNPILIAYYSYQTAVIGRGISGLIIIYVFFVISAILCKLAAYPLVNIIVSKEKAEGNFRFLHVLIRTSLESIALQSGESNERDRLFSSFSHVLKWQRKLLDANLILRIFTEIVNYFGAVLAYIVLAVPIFDGTYDDKSSSELSEIIAQNLFVTLYLIYQLTVITGLSQR